MVAYDEDLADRIRDLIAGESDLTERKMCGGLAFLIGPLSSVTAQAPSTEASSSSAAVFKVWAP